MPAPQTPHAAPTEALLAVAFAMLRGVSPLTAGRLCVAAGSLSALYAARHDVRALLPKATPRLQQVLAGWDELLPRAERELAFASAHGISVLPFGAADYPRRLMECPDAPPVLFYRGSAPLNGPHVVAVVGTRRCTDYGRRLCAELTAALGRLVPDALVLSGLAYGIDIHAHRGALAAGLNTVAVLAHGLDRLYPPRHRETALQMLGQGGLISEFTTGTPPDKGNFVRRNRIVAGMADCCVVVESARRGGGLITADLAQSYAREVFACPGRVDDEYSEGCNRLIESNGAQLLLSGEHLARAMGWITEAPPQPEEGDLFADASPEERRVLSCLSVGDGKQLNLLVAQTGLSVQRLMVLLFGLESRGLVRRMGGTLYARAH